MIHHAAVLTHGTDHVRNALLHAEACGYQLHSIVNTWSAALQLLVGDLAQVIVVADRTIWTPTIEYADRITLPTITAGESPNARIRERRARMMRRN